MRSAAAAGQLQVPQPRTPEDGSKPSADVEGDAVRRPRVLSELGLLLVVYVGYSFTRVLVDVEPAVARANGELVLSVERLLGLDVEAAAVEWLVGSTAASVLAGYAYAALHYTVTPLVLLWLYRVHPRRYRSARTVLVAATCAALLCYWLVPTAPPRLLASAYPDVLALTSEYGWWGTDASAPRGLGSLTNEYAALPSMHVGWAFWCALAVLPAVRRPLVRALAAGYPVLIVVVVIVTANHYVLDAVAGAVLVGGLTVIARSAGRLRGPARSGPAEPPGLATNDQ